MAALKTEVNVSWPAATRPGARLQFPTRVSALHCLSPSVV
jgi:hypothetical protein